MDMMVGFGNCDTQQMFYGVPACICTTAEGAAISDEDC